MTKETNVRVRMVRCPKCSKILVELPEFTLYKCGGCGTSLQAKNWKPGSSSQTSEEDEGANCGVDELCLGPSAPTSHSGSPEVNPPSNGDSIEPLGEECKNGPLSQPEDSSSKLDEEGRHSPAQGLHSGVDGGELGLASRDLGFVSSPVTFSNEGDNASQSSAAARTCEVAAADDGGGGGGDSSRSSPMVESHVSLYMTSPDDADRLEHSPAAAAAAARRFSSSDGYDDDINVRDFTADRKSGSYRAYYGSESSYDGNDDDLSFQHSSRRNRKNDKVASALSFTTTNPELVHELRNHSSFDRTSLPPRPISRPFHGPLSSSGPARMDLLRTVKELEDQLRKMQIPSRALHRPSGVQEKYEDPRQELTRSWGEPRGDHVGSSCLQCRPHSSQIRSHFSHHRCKGGHCTVQQRGGGHGCCDVSSPSPSPRHCCMGSSRSSTCDSPTCQDSKMKRLSSKEKHKPPKKHLLPLAGGAPFVACYYCLELLQLPAEFVIFDARRCHRLTCGSCKKVLRFSVVNGTKIVRRLPTAPPPSEDGESSDRRDCSDRRKEKVSSYGKMKSVLRDSQRTTSDGEERSKRSNSPLHRLMGYSSPGRVLNN